jgi:hypothetical protein
MPYIRMCWLVWSWMLLMLSVCLQIAAGLSVRSTKLQTFQLTPKATGMQGLRNVYSVDIAVDRMGPFSVLVDTGSPAVVVQGDFGEPAQSPSFLASDGAGVSTIHYGGATVNGVVSHSRMCLRRSGEAPQTNVNVNSSGSDELCATNFPVFQVQRGDAAFSQLGLDGVLGLGPASGGSSLGLKDLDETVPDGLAVSGAAVPRIFALYISTNPFFGPSMLSFGGYDQSKIQPGNELEYIPLAHPTTGRWELPLQDVKLVSGDVAESVGICGGKSDCRALLDSGTSQLASTSQLLEVLSPKLHSGPSGECIDTAAMPDMHVEFAGGTLTFVCESGEVRSCSDTSYLVVVFPFVSQFFNAAE